MIGCGVSGGGNENQQLQGRYRSCCSCVLFALSDSQLCTTEITKTTESHGADAGGYSGVHTQSNDAIPEKER